LRRFADVHERGLINIDSSPTEIWDTYFAVLSELHAGLKSRLDERRAGAST
jgi:hypothetical protein